MKQNIPRIKYYPRIFDFLGYLPFDDILSQPLRKRLVILRQIIGSSQTELAGRLGVDLSTICSWERGKTHPSKRIVDMIDALLSECPSKHSSAQFEVTEPG